MDQVGLLDEKYFMHCEDIDWCMRFRIANWKVLFVPTIQVVHHKGTCSKDYPIRVLFHMHRGMIRFYRKFFHKQYPLPLMLVVMITAWTRFLLLTARELMILPFREQTTTPIPTQQLFRERRKSPPIVAYIGPERRVRNEPESSPTPSNKSGIRSNTSNHEQLTP